MQFPLSVTGRIRCRSSNAAWCSRRIEAGTLSDSSVQRSTARRPLAVRRRAQDAMKPGSATTLAVPPPIVEVHQDQIVRAGRILAQEDRGVAHADVESRRAGHVEIVMGHLNQPWLASRPR